MTPENAKPSQFNAARLVLLLIMWSWFAVAAFGAINALLGMMWWSQTAAAGTMIVVGFAGIPLGLVSGIVFVPAPVGKAGRVVSLLMAGLLLGWWWYPALGRPAWLAIERIHQEADNRSRFGGCTQTTTLSVLPLAAYE